MRALQIPFESIADNTRWMRKPASFTSLDACLDATSSFYRRNLWAAMPVYVEIWCEKDALAGVLLTETGVYDVPLMTARGYSSLSFLYGAALAIKAKKKPAHIYHFGDLDPPESTPPATSRPNSNATSQTRKSTSIGRRLLANRSSNGIYQRGRPSRRIPGPRSFVGTSVELDAIPAAKLRELVRECNERHVDKQQLALLRIAEQSVREILSKWAGTLRGSAVPAEKEEAPE